MHMYIYIYIYIYMYVYICKAFIRALLSTANSRERFSFFTVYLVNYVHLMLLWCAPKLFVCTGSNFSWNFRVSWGAL